MLQKGGGDPAMVAFVTSYLFGAQPVHLNDFYFRPLNETRPSWTLPYVPGKRLTNKDVYILTSSRTFSGAEEFTYNLKHLKRAIVVGETTGGGAHLVNGRPINDHFTIGVPSGRPINAVTKTDWEGVGVEPDAKVEADKALKTAHLMALEKQEKTLPPDAPGLKAEVTATIQTLRKELDAVPRPSASAIDAAPPPSAAQAGDDFESGSLAGWKTEERRRRLVRLHERKDHARARSERFQRAIRRPGPAAWQVRRSDRHERPWKAHPLSGRHA